MSLSALDDPTSIYEPVAAFSTRRSKSRKVDVRFPISCPTQYIWPSGFQNMIPKLKFIWDIIFFFLGFLFKIHKHTLVKECVRDSDNGG
jgi:hypothetical protein